MSLSEIPLIIVRSTVIIHSFTCMYVSHSVPQLYILEGGGRVERKCWVNFQCWGVLLVWMVVGQGPIVRVGVFRHFFSHLSFLSPALWETARYRLKYCLKGLLNPKQPTFYKKILIVRHVPNYSLTRMMILLYSNQWYTLIWKLLLFLG